MRGDDGMKALARGADAWRADAGAFLVPPGAPRCVIDLPETAMHDFDDEEPPFDPDADPDGDGDGELARDDVVWQLLEAINPGDDELARAEFDAWREATDAGATDAGSIDALLEAIDWRSGFRVPAADARALIEVVDELCARWNLRVDWGGDVDDEDYLAGEDVPSLLARAHEQLLEADYALWAWRAADGAYAGWMTATRDAEAMAELAAVLGVEVRPGSDVE